MSKNLKKLLALMLTVCMVLSFTAIAFAADDDDDATTTVEDINAINEEDTTEEETTEEETTEEETTEAANLDEDAYQRGFVLGKDKITAADARKALRISAELENKDVANYDLMFKAADLNNDGTVTAAEARQILRWSAQLDAYVPDYPEPITNEPTTNEPTTNEPTTNEPTTEEPTTEEPTTIPADAADCPDADCDGKLVEYNKDNSIYKCSECKDLYRVEGEDEEDYEYIEVIEYVCTLCGVSTFIDADEYDKDEDYCEHDECPDPDSKDCKGVLVKYAEVMHDDYYDEVEATIYKCNKCNKLFQYYDEHSDKSGSDEDEIVVREYTCKVANCGQVKFVEADGYNASKYGSDYCVHGDCNVTKSNGKDCDSEGTLVLYSHANDNHLGEDIYKCNKCSNLTTAGLIRYREIACKYCDKAIFIEWSDDYKSSERNTICDALHAVCGVKDNCTGRMVQIDDGTFRNADVYQCTKCSKYGRLETDKSYTEVVKASCSICGTFYQIGKVTSDTTKAHAQYHKDYDLCGKQTPAFGKITCTGYVIQVVKFGNAFRECTKCDTCMPEKEFNSYYNVKCLEKDCAGYLIVDTNKQFYNCNAKDSTDKYACINGNPVAFIAITTGADATATTKYYIAATVADLFNEITWKDGKWTAGTAYYGYYSSDSGVTLVEILYTPATTTPVAAATYTLNDTLKTVITWDDTASYWK